MTDFDRTDECTMCRNGLYLYPQMKLFTAPCGHKYCDSCIHAAYMKDAVMKCLGCNVQIRRQTFVSLRFDDGGDKENNTRRRVLKVYNKRREDFTTLIDYNDYLEMVEDLVFEFMKGGESQTSAESKLKEYNRQNQTSIVINKKKKEDEDSRIATLIEEEQREAIEKRNFYKKQDLIDQTAKIQESLKTMNDLADGKISAKDIKELDAKKQLELQNQSATSILSYSESKKLINDSNNLNQQNNNQNNQNNNNLNNNNQNNNDNKYTYQATNKNQPIMGQPQNQQQQPQPTFNQPQPLDQFKYDEQGLKNLIPTQQQSDASGFKQRFIKQRAFEEAFSFLIC